MEKLASILERAEERVGEREARVWEKELELEVWIQSRREKEGMGGEWWQCSMQQCST